MTKEENIRTLNEHLDHWKRLLSEKICDQSEGEKTIDALQNAIKALEQEPCGDAISRQAVLDINERYHGQMPSHVNHEIWKEINALPTVTPMRKWIPCSERLPEHNRLVLCYITTGVTETYYLAFWNDKNAWEEGIGGCRLLEHYLGYKVIAWMPLQEPYKPEVEE